MAGKKIGRGTGQNRTATPEEGGPAWTASEKRAISPHNPEARAKRAKSRQAKLKADRAAARAAKPRVRIKNGKPVTSQTIADEKRASDRAKNRAGAKQRQREKDWRDAKSARKNKGLNKAKKKSVGKLAQTLNEVAKKKAALEAAKKRRTAGNTQPTHAQKGSVAKANRAARGGTAANSAARQAASSTGKIGARSLLRGTVVGALGGATAGLLYDKAKRTPPRDPSKPRMGPGALRSRDLKPTPKAPNKKVTKKAQNQGPLPGLGGPGYTPPKKSTSTTPKKPTTASPATPPSKKPTTRKPIKHRIDKGELALGRAKELAAKAKANRAKTKTPTKPAPKTKVAPGKMTRHSSLRLSDKQIRTLDRIDKRNARRNK